MLNKCDNLPKLALNQKNLLEFTIEVLSMQTTIDRSNVSGLGVMVVDKLQKNRKIGGTIDSGTIGFTKEVGIELNEIISQFIEFDNFGIDTNRPILESDDNIRARTLLEKDVKRNGNKYEAPLLWKTDNIDMPNNYEYAKKRYINFERQINYNPKLKENTTDMFTKKSDKESPRQSRHIDFIGQFTTKIEHIHGSENVVADMLSRILQTSRNCRKPTTSC